MTWGCFHVIVISCNDKITPQSAVFYRGIVSVLNSLNRNGICIENHAKKAKRIIKRTRRKGIKRRIRIIIAMAIAIAIATAIALVMAIAITINVCRVYFRF